MNILDENIIKSQRQLLKSWRIRIRQIGYEVGRRGIKDDEIIPLLLELRRATFFTRDLGFYERSLCHKRYCLVCIAVEKHETAVFIRRLLRHGEFDTQAKRIGTVIRVSRKGLFVWRLHAKTEQFFYWAD